MKGGIKYIVLLLLLVMGLCSMAQTKEDLQKKRNELNNKIAYTKKLILETREIKENTSLELSILNQQISFRQQLINNINSEIEEIEDEINQKQEQIHALEQQVVDLKEEYAKMVYQSYKSSSETSKLMFIFASSNFNQAFLRLKMMQHYSEVRKKNADEIMGTQDVLQAAINTLETIKGSKLDLARSKKDEKQRLSSDISEQQSKLQELKKQESKLRKKQQKQESERKRINKAIQRIIEEELLKEKNKNNGKFELTPAGKIISENFEKNKGQLPWPVLRGVITQKFGKQHHPTLPGITIDNKGIDIATDAEAKVYALFEGEVTSVFSIPGAGQNIIITHGAYKTVYTNLKSISVKKGDIVATKEEIGRVLTTGNQSTAHLEVWKISQSGGKALNPEYWISK